MIYIPDSIFPFMGGGQVALNLISILTPWLVFTANTPGQSNFGQTIPASDNSGSIYLYQTLGCTKYTNAVAATSPQGICSLITISNLPETLGYMRDAANTGIAFTILSLVSNVISLTFIYLAAAKKLHILFDENGHKVRYFIVGSNIAVVMFNVIAFSTFSGIFNAKFQMNTDGLLIGFAGTQNRTWNYGGGFGLSIVVAILSAFIAISESLHKRDQDKNNNTIINPMNPLPQSQTRQEGVEVVHH